MLYNKYPNWNSYDKVICSVIVQHPAISECCVLGLPDKAYGEAVTAIIVPDMEVKKVREKDLKPAITLDELCSWAKQKLAPYKVYSFLEVKIWADWVTHQTDPAETGHLEIILVGLICQLFFCPF